MMERYLPQLTERSRRWVRFAGLLAAIWGLWYLALLLRSVVTPIVAALAIAYILNPVVTWLERERKVSRTVSVSVLLGLILGIALLLVVAGTIQLIQLADSVDEYTTEFLAWVNHTFPNLVQPQLAMPTSAPATQPTSSPTTRPVDIAMLTKLAGQYGKPLAQTVYSWATAILSNVGYGLTIAVLIPLYTFFFLINFNDIVKTVVAHLPVTYRPVVVDTARTIDRAISNFFRGRLMVCSLVGLLNGLGWLLIGLKHSLLLGAVAGILNLVPFMSVLVLPPALILAFVNVPPEQSWFMPVVLTMGVYVIVQGIESFALTPLIEAKSSGLHAVTTVIALLIGGKLGGLLGMLLAIPIASTLKSLGVQYLLPEIRRLAAYDEVEKPPAPAAANAGEPIDVLPPTDSAPAKDE